MSQVRSAVLKLLVPGMAVLLLAGPAQARIGDRIGPVKVIGASDTELCVRYTQSSFDDDALYWCSRAIDRAENSISERAVTRLHRAVILQRDGRLDAAMADIDVAIRLFPGYGDAHMNRGNVLFQQGRFSEAVGAYDQAVSVGNSQPDVVFYNRSRAQARLGRTEAAAADLSRARELVGPGSPLEHRLTVMN
jgi:tetratricopeptide (TPR) repeat protein